MPVTVERYPGLVRINYDVREKVPVLSEESEQVRADVPVDVDVPVMYEYRMVEIRGDVPAYDKLTELLVTDKYPTGVLLTLLSDGSATEREAFRQFRFLCKQVAAEVLGLPETEAMQSMATINVVTDAESVAAAKKAEWVSAFQEALIDAAE